MIYLDNAATTIICDAAYQAMQPYLGESFFNANSPYTEARMIKREVEIARDSLAAMIGTDASKVYFTSGGSESDSWSIIGTAMYYINRGEPVHIVTNKIEHHAVLNSCLMAERMGATVTYLDVDSRGLVSLDELRKAIKPATRLVSVMLVNNEIGSINDIKALCKAVKEVDSKILFHSDAVQAFGNINIDVKELGVDLLSISSHKFNGPKGTGLLYCKDINKLCSLIYGGEQERAKRGGTTNSAGIIGMAEAAKWSLSRIGYKKEQSLLLIKKLIDRLCDSHIEYTLNGVESETIGQNHWPGIINLGFPGISGERLIALLEHDGILCSKAAACDGGSGKRETRSHVLQAIGVPGSLIDGSIRISFGAYNKPDDMDYVSDKIIERVDFLKNSMQ